MSTTLMYVGIGSLLALGVGTFAIAVLLLQTARRYVELTEKRLELLREGEAFLMKIVQRQGAALAESSEREAHRHKTVPEVVGYAIGRLPEDPDEYLGDETGIHDSPATEEGTTRRRKRTPKADDAATRKGEGTPLLGVQVPHPDDDEPGRGWNNSPAKFFQKCYDRYLEHYEGYVRLAERLHGMHGETGDDLLGEHEWEDKLRRAHDAIERTTQRLDMLEEHYPELATDSDRISSRIGTARLHADLTERFGRTR